MHESMNEMCVWMYSKPTFFLTYSVWVLLFLAYEDIDQYLIISSFTVIYKKFGAKGQNWFLSFNKFSLGINKNLVFSL